MQKMLLRSWMERKYDLHWLLSEQNAEPMFFFYFYSSELCVEVFYLFAYSVQLLLNLFILTVLHKKNNLTKTVCLKIEFHCCLYHNFFIVKFMINTSLFSEKSVVFMCVLRHLPARHVPSRG